MKVLLDQEPLPGQNHQVKAMGRVERRDTSGTNDSTSSSHEGWKPWLLQVKLQVRFDDPGACLALRSLFEKQATDGSPHVYEITEYTAAALAIHKVRFEGFLQFEPKDKNIELWDVSFSLVEAESVSARVTDQKTPPVDAEGKTPDGATEPPAGTVTVAANYTDGIIGEILRTLDKKAGIMLHEWGD